MPMLAIPLSIILGSPISGWLLDMHAPGGLSAWRWMFLAEGLPTVIAGVAAWFYFPDSPAQARWMDEADRAALARGGLHTSAPGGGNDWTALRNPLIWASALLWFCLLSGAYGIMFWLPQMVHQLTGLSAFAIGLVNALPWIGSALGIYFNAAHSDRTGERFWHIALPAALAGLALLGASQAGAGVPGLMLLFVAGLGLGAAQGAFWALPTALFVPATFAVGVVAINILGTSGGIIFPPIIGWAREATGNFLAPTLMMVVILFAAAAITLFVRARSTQLAA
jgi:MFS family permease